MVQVLLSSVRVLKLRRPSQMQAIFEICLSHLQTAYLGDLILSMQPHLTASVMIPMAASAASMLASEAQSHGDSTSATAVVLTDTVVMGPPQLPTISQMRQDSACSVVQLSLEVASGRVNIMYNGVSQMQTGTAWTEAAGSAHRGAQGNTGMSPRAVVALLGAGNSGSMDEAYSAVIGWMAVTAHDQSGYKLHPTVLETPVSLRALTAAQTDSAPIWLKSAAATVAALMSTDATSITATVPAAQPEEPICSTVSAGCYSALSQEGVMFASGQAYAATVVSQVARGSKQEVAEEGAVSAGSTLRHMDAQERKLYIQAQV